MLVWPVHSSLTHGEEEASMTDREANTGAPAGEPDPANTSSDRNIAERELQPTLMRAAETLASALDEACAADLDRIDTGELIRVEEVLAIANEAAKEVISVRRRLHRERPDQRIAAAGPESAGRAETLTPTEHATSDVASSRTVVDGDGRQWTVFAVYPSSARGRSVLREGFANGWLSFDAGNETRRLAPIPEAWETLSDPTLLELCAGAESSRPRRQSRDVPPRANS